MNEKLSVLDKQISDEITPRIADLEAAGEYRALSSPPYLGAALAALLAISLIAATGLVRVNPVAPAAGLVLAAVFHSAPLLSGLWLGFTWRDRHVKAYALLGAVIGATGY
jgi:hypothetical protein